MLTTILNIIIIISGIAGFSISFLGLITTIYGLIVGLKNKKWDKFKKGLSLLLKGILIIFALAIIYSLLSAMNLVGVNSSIQY
jgi:hypothetical protein